MHKFDSLIHRIASLIHGIASLIIKLMIRTWKIIKRQLDEINFPDQSSLDAITRQLPDGYYSTFRTYDGCRRVLGLSAHLQRLPNLDASLLRRQLAQLLKPFRSNEARVRLMETKQGELYISIEPLKTLPREVYEKGVRVETTEIRRESPRLKSTAFIAASDEERKHIAQAGVFEALLVKNGRILEGMTSNFFYALRAERSEERSLQRAQTKRDLYTAQRDILLGVTRKNVIRAAWGRGVDVKYQALNVNQISNIDEAFITSSSRGIVPVIQIDGTVVGEGSPGALTKELSSAYNNYVIQKAERI